MPVLVCEIWYARYQLERRRAWWRQFLSKHKPTVAARLERLNPPDGPPEGAEVRGLRYKDGKWRRWVYDEIPAREFFLKWGRKPSRISHKEGRKKWVTRMDYLDGY